MKRPVPRPDTNQHTRLGALPDFTLLKQYADYILLFKGPHTKKKIKQLINTLNAIDAQALQDDEKAQYMSQIADHWHQWML